LPHTVGYVAFTIYGCSLFYVGYTHTTCRAHLLRLVLHTTFRWLRYVYAPHTAFTHYTPGLRFTPAFTVTTYLPDYRRFTHTAHTHGSWTTPGQVTTTHRLPFTFTLRFRAVTGSWLIWLHVVRVTGLHTQLPGTVVFARYARCIRFTFTVAFSRARWLHLHALPRFICIYAHSWLRLPFDCLTHALRFHCVTPRFTTRLHARCGCRVIRFVGCVPTFTTVTRDAMPRTFACVYVWIATFGLRLLRLRSRCCRVVGLVTVVRLHYTYRLCHLVQLHLIAFTAFTPCVHPLPVYRIAHLRSWLFSVVTFIRTRARLPLVATLGLPFARILHIPRLHYTHVYTLRYRVAHGSHTGWLRLRAHRSPRTVHTRLHTLHTGALRLTRGWFTRGSHVYWLCNTHALRYGYATPGWLPWLLPFAHCTLRVRARLHCGCTHPPLRLRLVTHLPTVLPWLRGCARLHTRTRHTLRLGLRCRVYAVGYAFYVYPLHVLRSLRTFCIHTAFARVCYTPGLLVAVRTFGCILAGWLPVPVYALRAHTRMVTVGLRGSYACTHITTTHRGCCTLPPVIRTRFTARATRYRLHTFTPGSRWFAVLSYYRLPPHTFTLRFTLHTVLPHSSIRFTRPARYVATHTLVEFS